MAEITGLTAIVRGRVQGVYFRDFTQRHAARLGLVGYVRNVADGSVEIVAEGKKQDLEALLTLVRTGPTLARVLAVDVLWSEPTGRHTGFMVRSVDPTP